LLSEYERQWIEGVRPDVDAPTAVVHVDERSGVTDVGEHLRCSARVPLGHKLRAGDPDAVAAEGTAGAFAGQQGECTVGIELVDGLGSSSHGVWRTEHAGLPVEARLSGAAEDVSRHLWTGECWDGGKQ